MRSTSCSFVGVVGALARREVRREAVAERGFVAARRRVAAVAEDVLFLAVVAAAFVVVLAFEAVRPVACFARVVCERERPAELDAERPLEPEAGALRALAIVSPFVRGRSQPSPRPARLKTVPAAA